jgi:hypothetical protein
LFPRHKENNSEKVHVKGGIIKKEGKKQAKGKELDI